MIYTAFIAIPIFHNSALTLTGIDPKELMTIGTMIYDAFHNLLIRIHKSDYLSFQQISGAAYCLQE